MSKDKAMKKNSLKDKKIIVSFTSFPKRINTIAPMLNSIINQTLKADKIVLWLAQSEFSEKEKSLPEYILNFVKEGKLIIEWCDDLKSHKKYFYALKKYVNDIIILVDDDLIYDKNLIRSLINSYLLFPKAISAKRTHLMLKNIKENDFVEYNYWPFEVNAWIGKPSMQLFATTGAGTLIPPKLLNLSFFDEQVIKNICLYSDDIWLKAIETVSDIPIVQTEYFDGLKYVQETQKFSLSKYNLEKRQNDVQLKQVKNWLDNKFGENYFMSKIFNSDIGENLSSIESVCLSFQNKIDDISKRLRKANKTIRKIKKRKTFINRIVQKTKNLISNK